VNVQDRFKGMLIDEIKAGLIKDRADFTSVFINLNKDYNKAVGVRNHNAFGGKSIWFVGKRQWDRRGAVGTYNYEDLNYAANWDIFMENKPEGPIICVESIKSSKTVNLWSFDFPYNAIFVYGEEKDGIPEYIIDCADYILEIPMWGSVRSLNVSVSSGIIMAEYRRQYSN